MEMHAAGIAVKNITQLQGHLCKVAGVKRICMMHLCFVQKEQSRGNLPSPPPLHSLSLSLLI